MMLRPQANILQMAVRVGVRYVDGAALRPPCHQFNLFDSECRRLRARKGSDQNTAHFEACRRSAFDFRKQLADKLQPHLDRVGRAERRPPDIKWRLLRRSLVRTSRHERASLTSRSKVTLSLWPPPFT